jgi:hypothetical protein
VRTACATIAFTTYRSTTNRLSGESYWVVWTRPGSCRDLDSLHVQTTCALPGVDVVVAVSLGAASACVLSADTCTAVPGGQGEPTCVGVEVFIRNSTDAPGAPAKGAAS